MVLEKRYYGYGNGDYGDGNGLSSGARAGIGTF